MTVNKLLLNLTIMI